MMHNFLFNFTISADLVTKTDFDAKLQGLNKKIDFKGKGNFEEDDTQNYLVFQPMYRYFKRFAAVGSDNYIYIWKSKGLSDERINSITTSS